MPGAMGDLSRRLVRRLWLWLALAALVVALAGLLRVTILSPGDATWTRIQQTGVWRVGMDPSFPPFEVFDPQTGLPVGFDVDLANAIAARWGVRPEIVGVGFDELVDAVAAHRLDSAVSALPIWEWRAREVSFSVPYIDAGIVLAVPPGSDIRDPADLAGLRVAAEWGSEGDAQARSVQEQLQGDVDLVLKESADAALTAVTAGEADAVIVDAVSLALFNRSGGNLVRVGEPLTSHPFVVVVPADAPELLGAVNRALTDLAADGTLAQLKAQWLGPDMP